MRVLVVEDDPKISSFLLDGLQREGFTVRAVERGVDAVAAVQDQEFAAIVLDLMLPDIDGLSVVERLRADGDRTPILILSAKRSVDDRVRGLRSGGDDYLTKPFSFAELVVRLQALLRRSGSTAAGATRLRAADLTLDLVSRELRRGGQRIELQPKEFALLEYLLHNRDVVLSKSSIMERIWGYDFDPQTNIVDVLISRLRAKVDKGFEPKLIHTIRGVGYVLKTDQR